MDWTFNEVFALGLAAAGFIVILTGSVLVLRTRRTAKKATAAVEQLRTAAQEVARGAGTGAAVAESGQAMVDLDKAVSDAKDVISSLPDDDRYPGLLVFAGLVIITFSLVAAGVFQLSSV